MTNDIELLERLCEQHGLNQAEGLAQSSMGSIRLFRGQCNRSKSPLMYEPGVVMIFQGYKIGYMADRTFEYGPEQCLLITTPYPIECETHASEEEPLMGLYLSLDPVVLNQIKTQIRSHQPEDFYQCGDSKGVDVIPRDERMKRALKNLLLAMQTPMDSALLGPQCINEIFYLLLIGPHRNQLASFCQQDHAHARIAQVLDYVQQQCHQKITVEQLADQAGMSASAFHRSFKQTVSDSPLQYLKKIRLNKAKDLILNQGLAASTAAYEVGYESAPQFSREFKRYFGVPPSKAAEIGYQAFGA